MPLALSFARVYGDRDSAVLMHPRAKEIFEQSVGMEKEEKEESLKKCLAEWMYDVLERRLLVVFVSLILVDLKNSLKKDDQELSVFYQFVKQNRTVHQNQQMIK